ncbi:MAG: Rne/Rng family ribonuclease [bacterium]
MANQKMLVTLQEGETRIALTESNQLVDLHVEQMSRERTVGNIYRGVVVKLNPAFQAAFIDYGEKRNGFLSISDVNPNLFEGGGRRGNAKIQSALKNGQSVMVQVLKEGVGDKGAALTTFISLPGRYLVLTPNSDRSGVSRKIEDSDKRSPLKDILAGLVGSEKIGVIIRTAGIDRSPADLKKDLANLRKEWKKIDTEFNKAKKPGLLFREHSSLIRVLRDYFSDSVAEVWVDSAEAFQEALVYFKATLPRFQKRLQLYVGDKSLFSSQGIEPQIEALDSSKVPLKSGGGIVIEPTEALVSIDVNSGRSNQASDVETTALNTNLEAAGAVARQLRLRNLGGLIVIDFIDMVQAKNRAMVKAALEEGLKDDKARSTIGTISGFGLLELTRQRIDMELSRGSRVPCAHCGGTGFVPTENASANNVLRQIRELAATGRYQSIHGELALEHANFLLNRRRESLRDLETEFDIQIFLNGNPAMSPGSAIRLSGTKGEDEKPEEAAAEPAAERPAAERPAAERPAADEPAGRSRRRRGRRGRGAPGEEAPAHAGAEEEEMEEAEQPATEDETPSQPPERWEPEDRPVAAAPPNGGGPRQDPAPPQETPQGETRRPGGQRQREAQRPPAGPRPQKPPAVIADVPPGRTVAPSFGKKLSEKRGAWIATLGKDAAVGDTLFDSSHVPIETEEETPIQPTFTRSRYFETEGKKDNTTLFISGHRAGQQAPEEPPAPTGKGRASARPKKAAGAKTAAKAPARKGGRSAKAAEGTESKTGGKKPAAKTGRAGTAKTPRAGGRKKAETQPPA